MSSPCLHQWRRELNETIRVGLERRGLTVVHMAGLGITDNFGICNVTPGEIVAFAERELASRQFELLFISCTNFRAVEARPLLTQRFGVPVVTSNQATIDAAFDAIGVSADWPLLTQYRRRQQLDLGPARKI